MDVHQRYLKQICRVCGTIKTDCRDINSVSEILIEAFPNDAGNYVSKDSDEVSVKGLCNQCYHLLTKWNKDKSKFNLFKRKNPASPKVFSSNTVLPVVQVEDQLVSRTTKVRCQVTKVVEVFIKVRKQFL